MEQQAHEIRRYAMEMGRGRAVIITSNRAVMAAVLVILLPQMPQCEGTHWRVLTVLRKNADNVKSHIIIVSADGILPSVQLTDQDRIATVPLFN